MYNKTIHLAYNFLYDIRITCILRSVCCNWSRDSFSDSAFLQIDSVKVTFSDPNDFVDRSAYVGSGWFISILSSGAIEVGFILNWKYIFMHEVTNETNLLPLFWVRFGTLVTESLATWWIGKSDGRFGAGLVDFKVDSCFSWTLW